jgi:hypothetical protein
MARLDYGPRNPGESMILSAEVLVAAPISTAEAAQLVDDFKAIGLGADLRLIPARRSANDIAWLVLAALPVQPFLNQLAGDLGTDAYGHLKDFVSRILHRPETATMATRLLVFQDTDTGVHVVLEPDLPTEGYQELFRLDFSAIHRGPLHYDMHYRRWRSELDEGGASDSFPT